MVDAATGPSRAVRLLRGAMESLVLALVVATPWVYGAKPPGFALLLYAGVAILLLLWGVRMLVEGKFTWARCPVALCLAGLFLVGALQVAPLPRDVVGWLSPGTVRLIGPLLPAEREVLPAGTEEGTAADGAAPATISVYAAAGRQPLVQLLAVFLVFAVVRNNVASPRALVRLAVVAVLNGVALSLFAVVQYFTAPPRTLYWAYESLGQVYGPFVCRNHFPFYVNVCAGLGLGLLLSRAAGARDLAAGRWNRGVPAVGVGRLLGDAPALWLVAALAILMSGVALSLSRGGCLAMLAGLAVCVVIQLTRSARFFTSGIVLLTFALALGLVGWVGFGELEARLTTLTDGEPLQARAAVWARTVGLAWDFPVWGTGYGTFPYVEPLTRSRAEDVDYFWDHAHNDYLEALVEGGLARAALSLAAVALVFRLGYRAVCRGGNRPGAWLALGGLSGVTAIAVHSVGDFGLHIPAVALLVTVLCAQLAALGASRDGADPGTDGGEEAYTFRLAGLAPVVAAGTAVLLGLVLVGEGWREHRLDLLRRAARRAHDPASREGQFPYLQAAARLAPGDALMRLELARAHFAAAQTGLVKEGTRESLTDAGLLVLAFSPAPAPAGAPPVVPAVASWLAGSDGRAALTGGRTDPVTERHLGSALRHLVAARDLCPLLADAQVRLATNASRFWQADTPALYLERARRLAPTDAGVWYLSGVQDLGEGKTQRAWGRWRRSLELSDRYAEQILRSSVGRLLPEEVLDRLLPDEPGQLRAAAWMLFPAPEAVAERRPFLERALAVADRQPAPRAAKDYQIKAMLHAELGQWKEATVAWRVALAQDPKRVDWRYELCKLLHEAGRLQEAKQELDTVLAQQPGHTQARQLLERVTRGLARGN